MMEDEARKDKRGQELIFAKPHLLQSMIHLKNKNEKCRFTGSDKGLPTKD